MEGEPWPEGPEKEYMHATCEDLRAWLQTQDLQDRNFIGLVDIDDLLCFYDVKKSQQVANCCGVLAELLKTFLNDRCMVNEIEE
jgi:hypothetical protein